MAKTKHIHLGISGVALAGMLAGVWAFYNVPGVADKLTDPEGAAQALRKQFPQATKITTGGYGPYGCLRGELISTKFTVTMPERSFSGTVCRALINGKSRIAYD